VGAKNFSPPQRVSGVHQNPRIHRSWVYNRGNKMVRAKHGYIRGVKTQLL